MTASAEATLIAGVLAARSRLEEPLDEAAVLQAASELIDLSTVWVPMLLDQPGAIDEYRFAANDAPAEWQPPDDAVVTANDAALADLLRENGPTPIFAPIEAEYRLDELQPHCRTCTCRQGGAG